MRRTLVSPVLALVPRCRRAAPRAWSGGRPHDHLALGPALRPRTGGAAAPSSQANQKSWRVDETYVRVRGRWCYLYRALDSTGATIDFVLSRWRDAVAAKRLFRKALAAPVASSTPCHQHGPGTPLRLGDCRNEKGRHPATPLPPPAGPILEQHRGTGSSSDQTTRESQAGVSRVSGGAANHPSLRGYAHDLEGTGEVGERVECSATDSVHPQAVRSGGVRRSRGDSTSRALVTS